MKFPEQVVLAGQHIELRPLLASHHDELCNVVCDGDLWRSSVALVPSPQEMAAYIQTGLSARTEWHGAPFVVIERRIGRVVGHIAYRRIHLRDSRLEIGSIFIRRDQQGSAAFVESCRLLLCHAFQELDCARAEFFTDARNLVARQAIRALGATEEGVLRSHYLAADGGRGDTVCFGVLRDEWPEIRGLLDRRIAAKAGASFS